MEEWIFFLVLNEFRRYVYSVSMHCFDWSFKFRRYAYDDFVWIFTRNDVLMFAVSVGDAVPLDPYDYAALVQHAGPHKERVGLAGVDIVMQRATHRARTSPILAGWLRRLPTTEAETVATEATLVQVVKVTGCQLESFLTRAPLESIVAAILSIDKQSPTTVFRRLHTIRMCLEPALDNARAWAWRECGRVIAAGMHAPEDRAYPAPPGHRPVGPPVAASKLVAPTNKDIIRMFPFIDEWSRAHCDSIGATQQHLSNIRAGLCNGVRYGGAPPLALICQPPHEVTKRLADTFERYNPGQSSVAMVRRCVEALCVVASAYVTDQSILQGWRNEKLRTKITHERAIQASDLADDVGHPASIRTTPSELHTMLSTTEPGTPEHAWFAYCLLEGPVHMPELLRLAIVDSHDACPEGCNSMVVTDDAVTVHYPVNKNSAHGIVYDSVLSAAAAAEVRLSLRTTPRSFYIEKPNGNTFTTTQFNTYMNARGFKSSCTMDMRRNAADAVMTATVKGRLHAAIAAIRELEDAWAPVAALAQRMHTSTSQIVTTYHRWGMPYDQHEVNAVATAVTTLTQVDRAKRKRGIVSTQSSDKGEAASE